MISPRDLTGAATVKIIRNGNFVHASSTSFSEEERSGRGEAGGESNMGSSKILFGIAEGLRVGGDVARGRGEASKEIKSVPGYNQKPNNERGTGRKRSRRSNFCFTFDCWACFVA